MLENSATVLPKATPVPTNPNTGTLLKKVGRSPGATVAMDSCVVELAASFEEVFSILREAIGL